MLVLKRVHWNAIDCNRSRTHFLEAEDVELVEPPFPNGVLEGSAVAPEEWNERTERTPTEVTEAVRAPVELVCCEVVGKSDPDDGVEDGDCAGVELGVGLGLELGLLLGPETSA